MLFNCIRNKGCVYLYIVEACQVQLSLVLLCPADDDHIDLPFIEL